MAQLLYSIESDALPSDAHVVAFTGREAISEPDCFQIGMQTEHEHFDPGKAVRAKAKLTFNLGSDADPYFINGILEEVELVHQNVGKALYRLKLVRPIYENSGAVEYTLQGFARQVVFPCYRRSWKPSTAMTTASPPRRTTSRTAPSLRPAI